MAQQAVDRYLTQVSENTLLKEQDSVDLRNFRQDLLKSALEYYQQFVDQRKDDSRLGRELADAYFRVGQIARVISSPQQAIESLRSAESIWERLAAKDPENDELQDRVAVCQMKIGELLQITGDPKGALNMLTRAHAILEPVARRNAQAPLFQANLADCLTTLGLVRADLEFPDEALAILQRARVIREQLVKRSPKDTSYQRSLAEVINNLGYVYYKRLDYPAAHPCVPGDAGDLPDPAQAKSVRAKAGSRSRLAARQLLQHGHDPNEARPERTVPSIIRTISALSVGAGRRAPLGDLVPGGSRARLSRDRRPPAFRPSGRESVCSCSTVARSLGAGRSAHPDGASYRSELGRSWNMLGVLHDERRDNSRAMPAFQRAVAEQERAIALSNDVNDYKVLLTIHLDNLGEQYIDLGKVDEGLGYYLKALGIREGLHLVHPGNGEYALDFIQAVETVGTIEGHAGRVGAARESFTRRANCSSSSRRPTPAMPRSPDDSGRL